MTTGFERGEFERPGPAVAQSLRRRALDAARRLLESGGEDALHERPDRGVAAGALGRRVQRGPAVAAPPVYAPAAAGLQCLRLMPCLEGKLRPSTNRCQHAFTSKKIDSRVPEKFQTSVAKCAEPP